MSNKRLVMVGASGHGKVCAEIAKLSGRYGEIFFLERDHVLTECGGYKVILGDDNFYKHMDPDTEFFVSIGNTGIRKRIQEEIESLGGRMATLIHASAVISDRAEIGAGTVIMAGAVVNPDVRIGRGVIINTTASVDHDCVIGDFSHVAVGAHVCGTVKIGSECWIGAGSTVSNNVSVCDKVTIGAGGVVIKNIDTAGTYVGVPVRSVMKDNLK